MEEFEEELRQRLLQGEFRMNHTAERETRVNVSKLAQYTGTLMTLRGLLEGFRAGVLTVPGPLRPTQPQITAALAQPIGNAREQGGGGGENEGDAGAPGPSS
ncbi:hypothetical protein BSKO_04606 [Bryopsis sp. KO-2023]|nr:hypothetical protein BSKO_04606 [Bryopsis sp. KO-2023]